MSKLRVFFNYLVISVLLITIYSCSRQKEVKEILSNAENMVEQKPDSALRLLNTILFPEDLNKSQFNKYNLLLLEAKDKSYKDITSDTIIFAVRDYYARKKDYPNAALAAFYCGRVRHEQNNIDSAFYYYNESLKLATLYNMPELQFDINENMGVAYREQGLYEQAKKLFEESLAFPKDSVGQVRILLNLAQMYVMKDDIDSANFYLDKVLALQISDPWLMRSSYLLRSKIEEKNNRCQEALSDYKEYYHYTSKVFNNEKDNKLPGIQEKYDYENLKISKEESELKHQKAVILLLIASIIIGIVIFIHYRTSTRNKKLISDLGQQIENLQKMGENFSKESHTSFRNILLEQFGILRKTALINNILSEYEQKSGQKLLKRFNQIVYGQDTLDWNKLYQSMDSLKNGFYGKIRQKYPQLNDTEFRLCCLTCETDFNDKEIGIILGKTLDMVRRTRSDVRKKVGMSKGGDFLVFFENTIQ